MELQKFYGIMAYYPMKLLEEPQRTEYKHKILMMIEEQMERRQYNNYTKYFLYLQHRKIEHELTKMIKAWSKQQTPESIDFLRKLKNLTKNIKRVVYVRETKTFPDCYSEMTTSKLVTFIKEYGRLYKLKNEPDITVLQTDKYLKLAEEIWPEAKKYYYNK